jgi:hypothetical protein
MIMIVNSKRFKKAPALLCKNKRSANLGSLNLQTSSPGSLRVVVEKKHLIAKVLGSVGKVVMGNGKTTHA